MSKTWLSLLVPVFNCKPYLESCLASISAQGCDGLEVIFYDDSSTDGSRELLHALKTRKLSGIEIKVICGENNRGLSFARNCLVDAATSEYLWFLDADDYLYEGALAQVFERIKINRPDCILLDYCVVPDEIAEPETARNPARYVATFDGVPSVLCTNKERLFAGMFRRRRFQAWARVMKKSVWTAGERFPEGRYFEDLYCVPRASLHVASYVYLRRSLLAYRSRQNSIVRTPDYSRVEDMLLAPAGVLQYWQQHGVHISGRARFYFYNFCATNFVNACKMLNRAGLAGPAQRDKLRKIVFSVLGIGFLKLIAMYLYYWKPTALVRVLRYMYTEKGLKG